MGNPTTMDPPIGGSVRPRPGHEHSWPTLYGRNRVAITCASGLLLFRKSAANRISKVSNSPCSDAFLRIGRIFESFCRNESAASTPATVEPSTSNTRSLPSKFVVRACSSPRGQYACASRSRFHTSPERGRRSQNLVRFQ